MQLRRDEFIEFAQFLTGSILRVQLFYVASSGRRPILLLVEFIFSVSRGLRT